jgi:uncharacterized membrane protein YgcG
VSDNSSWWLLLPCGIVTLAVTITITTLVVVFRRMRRQVTGSLRGTGQSGTTPTYGAPLDAMWTPDANPATPAESHHHHQQHHQQHWESHGHTIHHHDSGSSSSGSDSGSSSSGGDSGSSHHHHSG